ncbi:MAG: TIR domain-containing protein [Bacteroidales bacterium]|nr:TIR domain-containing protein [Bacteroidales bacterium]
MADYYISKVLYQQSQKIIDRVEIYPNNGEVLGESKEINRNTLVQYLNNGKTFATMTKKIDGKWKLMNNVSLIAGTFIKIQNNLETFDDLGNIPVLLTKRKTFVSYYHKDDEQYKKQFEMLTSDLIVKKSVGLGGIDSDNSDEYIKQLIQKEYLKDTTVLIVLIGPKTKCRKHVDWEISGALDLKVGDHYAGLLGILLPNHPDYNKEKFYYSNLPNRLAKNVESSFAKIINWTEDRLYLQNMIEDAFKGRKERSEKRINKSITQMINNTCG